MSRLTHSEAELKVLQENIAAGRNNPSRRTRKPEKQVSYAGKPKRATAAKKPTPRCKFHKTRFEQKYFNQKFCLSDEACIKAFVAYNRGERAKNEQKSWNQRKEILKDKVKTLSDYKKELQTLINAIVRMIDFGQPCIATGATTGKMNAGHYISIGSNDTLRYHFDNIHIQSEHSNTWKSGDTIRYQEGLKRVYGQEYFDYVESLRSIPAIKLTIFELKEKIIIARKILKDLQAPPEQIYDRSARLYLRKNFNRKLGIYILES